MLDNELSKSAHIVQKCLCDKGLPFKVVQLSESTRTAQEAANTIGCKVAQIVKFLVFRTKDTGKAILILASGVNRVNEKKFKELLGEELTRPDAEFVREVTGFAIGGIPPVGHKNSIETYIDEDLLTLKELWAAAGTPNAVFSLPSGEIVNLTGGKVVSVY